MRKDMFEINKNKYANVSRSMYICANITNWL